MDPATIAILITAASAAIRGAIQLIELLSAQTLTSEQKERIRQLHEDTQAMTEKLSAIPAPPR